MAALCIVALLAATVCDALRPPLRMTAAVATRPEKVVVLGAGPSGLVSAIALARRGFENIKVYERLEEPPNPASEYWSTFNSTNSDRFYLIGINGRGQSALKGFDLMDDVEKYSSSVNGRFDWSAEAPVDSPKITIFTDRKYVTKCIIRDRLNAVLIDKIRRDYSNKIELNFGQECVDISFERPPEGGAAAEKCRLRFERSGGAASSQECSFVVGADGVRSLVRERFADANKGFRFCAFADKNVRVYRTIPFSPPKGWRKDVNYSCRTKYDVNFDALPTREGTYIGVLLYRPHDSRVTGIASGREAREFFREHLPQFAGLFSDNDLERFAMKKESRFPSFTYATNIASSGGSAALLGDAIHSVKPYFGQGLNSALEDCVYLDRSLVQSGLDVPRALAAYSRARSPDAKALVQISRSLDGGFLTFVLPLIVDSVLNKALPRVFAPNKIAMLQDQDLSFSHILRRKRLDRALQLLLLGGVLRLAQLALHGAARLAARVLV